AEANSGLAPDRCRQGTCSETAATLPRGCSPLRSREEFVSQARLMSRCVRSCQQHLQTLALSTSRTFRRIADIGVCAHAGNSRHTVITTGAPMAALGAAQKCPSA